MRSVFISVTAAAAVVAAYGISEAQPRHGSRGKSAIQLFRATPVSESAPCVEPGACSPVADRNVFDEASLLLSCPAHPTAWLASTADGRGALAADNYIEVNGRDVCVGGAAPEGIPLCFNPPFVGGIGTPALQAYQPLPPIDISGQMPRPGKALVTFRLVDYGGVYANSDLWLITDCAIHQKTSICHKPGTPAEKVLTVGFAAVAGHLRHGDTLDLTVCRR